MVRSETVSNLAVALLALTVTYALAQKYIAPSFGRTSSASAFRSGERFTSTAQELGLASSPVTAVVVVSSQCRFCAESADFYRRLAAGASAMGPSAFRVIFVGVAGADDAAAFAKAHDLSLEFVRPIPAELRKRIASTPTLLILRGDGSLVQNWIGRLTDTQEAAVLSVLTTAVSD